MTDAQDPGMAEAVREIDRVIRLRKGDLDINAGEMAETQARLTSLVDQAARLRLVINALTAVRESLTPTPETDAPTPPASPLDVTCPTCGAEIGQICYPIHELAWIRGTHPSRITLAQSSHAEAPEDFGYRA